LALIEEEVRLDLIPFRIVTSFVIFGLNPQGEVVDGQINVCQVNILAHLSLDVLQYDLKVFIHHIFDKVFVDSNVVVCFRGCSLS
jgi:hypothetical protein